MVRAEVSARVEASASMPAKAKASASRGIERVNAEALAWAVEGVSQEGE